MNTVTLSVVKEGSTLERVYDLDKQPDLNEALADMLNSLENLDK